jgi:hypothetical protein
MTALVLGFSFSVVPAVAVSRAVNKFLFPRAVRYFARTVSELLNIYLFMELCSNSIIVFYNVCDA